MPETETLRRLPRVIVAALLVFAACTLITVPAGVSAVTARLALTATTLFMGGTDHPLTVPEDSPAYIGGYVDWAYADMVGPSGLCTGGDPGCALIAIYGPEQFWPVTGLHSMTYNASVALGLSNLDNCLSGAACTLTDPPYTATGSRTLTDTSYVVFSYSQSGATASIQKSNMIAHPPAGTVSFVFDSNPNRPNGGVLSRFVGAYIPILDVTFNGATVTNSPQPTPLTTVDFVHQYDPVGDFPINPLNLIAVLNSLFAFAYEHPEGEHGVATLQGQFQDSTYYLFPTDTLPLVRPLTVIPFLGPLLATVLDPPLRVLAETGYDRTINPGAPTPAKYLYFPNPIATAVNLLAAIPTGWDNGIAYLTQDPANRPFGTTPPGPYGVGGPPVYAGAVDPYGPPTPSTALTAAPTSTGLDAQPPAADIRATITPARERPSPRTAARAVRAAPAASAAAPAGTGHRVQAEAAPEAADGPSARSAVPNRRSGSSTGPSRSRSWSAQ